MSAPITQTEVDEFLRIERLDMARAQQLAIYRLCQHYANRHKLRSEHTQDIAHAALANAFGGRAAFRGHNVPMFCGWLRAIVLNAVRDQFRKEYARPDRWELRPKIVHFVADNTPRPEERYALRSLLDACETQVLGSIEQSCLSVLERDVLRCVGWLEQDAAEAAAALKLTAKQFENALYRARSKLRERLTADRVLEPAERIIKDRLFYNFAPNAGQWRASVNQTPDEGEEV